MTTTELAALIGRRGLLRDGLPARAMAYPIVIRDARERFGRLDLLVEPVDGTGEGWVCSEHVTVTP